MNQRICGLAAGLAAGAIGLGVGLTVALKHLRQASPHDPLVARLDTNGPCLLLSTEAAARDYAEALAEARKLHPGAPELVFRPENLAEIATAFKNRLPRYALVLILPQELDVNFAWAWLALTTQANDDPFVDVRTGFITGETPAAAAAFVRRIRTAVEERTPLAGLAVDDLGPNTTAPKDAFVQSQGNFMIPVLGQRLGLSTISHGTQGFGSDRLTCLHGAGLVHFGGHGYPDRVVDGVDSGLVRQLKLSPCVVLNGACYTGVTGRWFDLQGRLAERQVSAGQSFCLGLLSNNVLGYLAALHPDHGIPVYQEMEFLATDGASLGDVIKHTYDGIILAAGGRLPSLAPFTNGMPFPAGTPADVMLQGTASRVLFGDPTLILSPAFAAPSFDIHVDREDAKALRVTAVLKNDQLKATFTDTYHADLSSNPDLFNDRALITCQLPEDWQTVQEVEVIQVNASGKPLKSRIVGFGVAQEGGTRFLHVQVDVPTTGFMQSAFRVPGARVQLRVRQGVPMGQRPKTN